MASVVEESINSIPEAQLALLRDKLLQQMEPEDDTATSSQPDPSSAIIDNVDLSPGLAPATVPESLNAYRTPRSSSKAPPPPRMNVPKSAGEVEMEAMMTTIPHHTPSQEAFATLTRASSFHGYPGGDTQPMESQVYRDFKAEAIVTPAKGIVKQDTYDTCGTEKTAHTIVEGDTQYADLITGLTSPTARSNGGFNDEDDFDPTQTEAAAALLPETPAIAGHKRRRSGEILTSVTTAPKTLAFSQLFGGNQGKPILSATQAFNQTQAPSSPGPMPDGPRSDPAFTRPSPNLINRLATSSPPLLTTSSPIEVMKPSTAGEPRDYCRSMWESQERRALLRMRSEALARRKINDNMFDEDDDDDDEFPQVTRKRLQRAKSDQAMHAIRQFGAPSRPNLQDTPRPSTAPVVDLTTPAVKKSKVVCDITESDAEEQESDEEALVEEEAAVGLVDLEDDQYDELAQTVIRSQVNEEESEHGDVYMNDGDNEGAEGDVNDMETIPDSTNIAENESGPPRTQHPTVADSQPTRREPQQSTAQRSMQPPSSMSLFVPGSQYAGKTSQDQARLAKQSWTLPEQRTSSSTDQPPQRVPSSPPLPANDTTVSTDGLLDRTSNNPMLPHEIPESDIPMSDANLATSSRPVSANGRVEAESKHLPVFSTAPTHLTQPAPLSRQTSSLTSPVKILASQQTQTASQSPITAAGVRRMAEIDAMQSPQWSNETQVSVDAIMNDIMTAEDEDYLQVVSSAVVDERPAKRRRLARREIGGGEELAPAVEPVVENKAVGEDEGAGDAGDDEQAQSEPIAPKALRESPSKANEIGVKTPERRTAQNVAIEKGDNRSLSDILRGVRKRRDAETPAEGHTDEVVQDSVREREDAGAKAVSQLISKRSTKRTQKTYLSKAKALKASKANSKQKRDGLALRAVDVEAEAEEGFEDSSESKTAQEETVPDANETENDRPQIVAPHRIFALFKGTHNNFYTATWLHSLPDGLSHRIKFDDDTQTSMELQHIRRLELRVGDQVKINVDGMRGKNWVVTSLNSTAEEGVGETDIYGRTRLQVQAKSARSSLPTSTAAVEDQGESVEVGVADVYLTHTMWPHFSDRVFNPPTAIKLNTNRAVTPASTAQTTNAETPNSRTRRSLGGGKSNVVRSLYARDEGMTPADGFAGIGLFANMAFAISYVSNEGEKSKVMRAIKAQGGIILDKGFDQLFDFPNAIDASIASPGKKSLKDNYHLPAETSSLKLRQQYEELGFVALVADRHSRRVKYMQALALGIPTLSSRWILDSLDTARNSSLTGNEATPLYWTKYLLPGEESSYLNGAIRSRTLPDYTVGEAKLSNTLIHRSLLLRGEGVLIVAPKNRKSGASERSKTYAFLTLALGAGVVKHIADLQEARALTADAPEMWKWVYVDGDVGEAGKVVFGKRETGGAGKKRRRGGDGDVADGVGAVDKMVMARVDGVVVCMCNGIGGTRVVNDEFVVQSLILGALID